MNNVSGCARWIKTTGLLAVGALACWQATAQTGAAHGQVEAILATSLVLTDSEAVTFGVRSFDPASFPLLSGEQYASANSLERRRSVTTYAFPAKWQLSDDDARLKSHIKLQGSYIQFERDVVFETDENSTSGRNRNSVYGAYLANEWSYEITDRWRARVSGGVHALRYKGRGGPVIDTDALFDSDLTALVGEVQSRLRYRDDEAHLPWEFQSTYSYYYGRPVGSTELENIRPETWTWANGFIVRWHLDPLWDTPNQLRMLARRIELGGDVIETFHVDHYYELGVGWLFKTEDPSWLDNIGLNVSLNIGSALSGGSLVLLYNEEF